MHQLTDLPKTLNPPCVILAPNRTCRISTFSWLPRGIALLAAVLFAGGLRAQNGIFADFNTSLGAFTCQLDYTNAPKAVANFVGLATAQKSWLDESFGKVRTNTFFNGLTFHRVIAGFMIQGGSPNGQGTDGPGYAFTDEFVETLTFNRFGVLAMANSGTNSNGAQFFITVGATPWLNRAHTIFGQLVAGSNVVYAISRVATDSNTGKPLTNVVIQQVTIRREGAAAQAFDIRGQGLPLVSDIPLKIAPGAGFVAISFTNALYADNRIYTASALGSAWTENSLGIETVQPLLNAVQVAADLPARFFRMARVQYPNNTLAPKTLSGKTMNINFTSGLSGAFTASLAAAGTGTFNYGGKDGSILYYEWEQEPYRGSIFVVLSAFPGAMYLKADFASANSGRVTGTAYPNYPSTTGAGSVAGTFALSGP